MLIIYNLFLFLSLILINNNILSKFNCINNAITKKYNNCTFPVFTCTNDVFCQLYPNQNMCDLLNEIPKELRNLSYVIYPNCPNYNIFRFIYNKLFNIFPHAIIRPCTEEQLVYVLKILRKYNLEFSVLSGGHCHEPGSLSSGYVIDTGNFSDIKINLDKQEVYVGAGNRLGAVIEALGNCGYAIPTGTCGTNGVSGLTLGGGVGFLARALGLTCDVVKSIRILTADLKIITVDDNNFSDLFWALRGAGANSFGIVVGFTFKIFYVPRVSLLELKWDWDPAQVLGIASAWQSWISTLNNNITAELDFDYLNGKRSVTVFALKIGEEPFTEWQSAFASLNPQVVINRNMTYVESARILGDDSTLPFSKSKSKMLFKPLPAAAINIIINFFETLFINNKQFAIHLELDSAGGKSAQGDTAYFPRQAIAWFFQHMRWALQEQTDEAIAAITKFYLDIEPFTSPYSYTNIQDYALGNRYLNAYFGDHVNRLIQIKNKYDPLNIFHWRQSIPLAI